MKIPGGGGGNGSNSKKAPKKTDAYKKTTSRLKKNGNWQDAHQAVSMLLNE